MNALRLLILSISLSLISCAGLMKAKKEFYDEVHRNFDKNTYLSFGWGGNSGVIEFDSFVVVIDTKMEQNANQFYQSIRNKILNKKVYIINTHAHPDHTSGNYLFKADSIYIPAYSDALWDSLTTPSNHIGKLPYVKVKEERTLQDNSGKLRIIPVGTTHTQNDLIVYVESSKVLFAGDLLFNGYHPVLDKRSGANAHKWMKTLNNIARTMDVAVVVPGHGPIAMKDDIVRQADYFAKIIDGVDDNGNLNQVRRDFRRLTDLPGKSSFDKTVRYIKDENYAEKLK